MKALGSDVISGEPVVPRRWRQIHEAMCAKFARIAMLWRDDVIALALCLFAAWGSYDLSGHIDPVIFEVGALNIWFDADLPRIFIDMNYRDSEVYTTKRHPIAPLLEYAPVSLLRKGFGVERLMAVRLTMALVAGIWAALFYLVLRLIGCRRCDALIFTALALTSSAAMFWLVVPETIPFGSVTILLAVGFVAFAQRRRFGAAWYVLVSAASLSVTVTNWMFGVLASAVNHPMKRAAQITAYAFLLVTFLWILQKGVFPGAEFFFGSSDADFPDKESGGILRVIAGFFSHSIVMPAIETTHWFYNPNLAVMTVQPSWPGSTGIGGDLATAAWIGLFALGLWALWSIKHSDKLRAFLALGLLGQVALHSVFGREMFFYSLHYQPLLITIAALVLLTRARHIALALASIVIVFGGLNNFRQFRKATEFVRAQAGEAHLVQLAIRERPADPWPRGTQHLITDRIGRVLPEPAERPRKGGHIVLGWPGSRVEHKGYFEGGGNFSPGVGSFGVSVWLRNRENQVELTSDTIPLSLLRHRYFWEDPNEMPGIVTESPYYQALWSSNGPARWVLRLKAQANSATKPELVIRSVGPAGGPINLLEWKDRQLIINSRWVVAINSMPVAVLLGEEGKKGWMNERSRATRWSGPSGWGYARLELNQRQNYELVITDLDLASTRRKSFAEPRLLPRIELPDERFGASLRAQIGQLLMGLVSDGTRPGDPMSYPFSWLRDEAYIVVALARSGELPTAKELARPLAETDFFGGFGAEADAPGLAIWALAEVANQLRDLSYDQWVWPHVKRKADLIAAMLLADRPIHSQVTTPVIPLYTKPLPSADPDVTLVANPPRDGLITGRINNSFLPLYVSAASYRGLMDAASLAGRVGHPTIGSEWRKRAGELKRAWSRVFEKTEQNDSWTYARALWPTLAASSTAAAFSQALEAQWRQYPANNNWQRARDYTFRIAQAHDWLWLGRADRAWATLTAFWDHQETPGLYDWRTESNRENSFNRWKNVRGWLHGQDGITGQDTVTPSYTTAAELVLLQLDMLAYQDETAVEPTIVVGAGVQPSWLEHPIRVQGVWTAVGPVDWSWDGREISVKIHRGHPHVRLGPAFASNAPLKVEYLGS